MKKTFCDCCKSETKTYYILELFGDTLNKKPTGVPFENLSKQLFERKQYEICKECATKLVNWIEESPVGSPF